MTKETFKQFARNHPELAQNVLSGKTTWQKLYELYDIYGDDHSIWKSFLSTSTEPVQSTFKDLFNTFKTLDMESVQKGVTNIQKTITLLQDIGIGNNKSTNNTYEPRPLYKIFED